MYFNNLNTILLLSIICTIIAITSILLQTAFVIIFQHYEFRTITSSSLTYGFSGLHDWNKAVEKISYSSPSIESQTNVSNQPITYSKPLTSNNYILVLDYWERMINIQSALQRLVYLGVESNFTVVEPYIYNSKVSLSLSLPEHFHKEGLLPQPASLYYNTKGLYNTNHYTDYVEIRENFRLINQSKASIYNVNPIIIQAAVIIDWDSGYSRVDKSKSTKRKTISNNTQPFWWCDDKLRLYGMKRSEFGYTMGGEFHVERGVCLRASTTMYPSKFGVKFFEELYQFIRDDTRRRKRACNTCKAVAFVNYRKHLFSGFIGRVGERRFSQKITPLSVSENGMKLADRIREEELNGRKYIALQMRTGKAYSVFRNDEQRRILNGEKVNNDEMFERWLSGCVEMVVGEVKRMRTKIGRNVGVYMGSDMYNGGWRGGEECLPRGCIALEKAKQVIERNLGKVIVFDPRKYGIRQDDMGMAGVADAAMCVKADGFVFSKPSNFGKWIHEQRAMQGLVRDTVAVDCRNWLLKRE